MKLSLEEIVIAKIAIEICNTQYLKTEILRGPGAFFYLYKKDEKKYEEEKLEWYDSIRNEAGEIIDSWGVLPHVLRERTISLILTIGMRMLTWTVYYENKIGLTSREFSINFFNRRYFSPEGIIDRDKTAEAMMQLKILNAEQKYKLACLHCFKDVIYSELSKQMMAEHNRTCFANDTSCIVLGCAPPITTLYKKAVWRLKLAISSGSLAAVKYCVQEVISKPFKTQALVEAALKTAALIPSPEKFKYHTFGTTYSERIPNDYLVDILYYILSEICREEKIAILTEQNHLMDEYEDPRRAIILKSYLLDVAEKIYEKCTKASIDCKFIVSLKEYNNLLWEIERDVF